MEPAPAADARRAGGSPGCLAHAGEKATAGGLWRGVVVLKRRSDEGRGGPGRGWFAPLAFVTGRPVPAPDQQRAQS